MLQQDLDRTYFIISKGSTNSNKALGASDLRKGLENKGWKNEAHLTANVDPRKDDMTLKKRNNKYFVCPDWSLSKYHLHSIKGFSWQEVFYQVFKNCFDWCFIDLQSKVLWYKIDQRKATQN